MTKSRQDQVYFRPRNWDKFQGYTKRGPKWIKLYTALLSDPDFKRNLTELQQWHCVQIWMLYAKVGKELPWDCGYVAAQLQAYSGTVGKTLKALESFGYIELVNKSVAKVSHQTETETETEKKGLPNGSPKESPAAPALALEPEPPPKPKPKSRTGTKLPEDWQPSPDDIAYARNRGFDEASIQDAVANFVDHFTNGNGRNKTRANWSLSWKRWVREQPAYAKTAVAGNATHGNRQGDGGIVAASRRVAAHFSDPSRPRPRPYWRDD